MAESYGLLRPRNTNGVLPVDDFNQMSNYVGQLENWRRSKGAKKRQSDDIPKLLAMMGDAYNQYQPPETALGMMALPAKAVYGLGNMIVQDVGDKTKSIMGTDINNPAAMNQAATDAFGLAADTMAGGGVVSRMTDMPQGAILGANVFQGGPHKYGPEGAAESLKHMGKGEGAQAYGYGRYDAESKGVAQDYKNTLGNKVKQEVVTPEGRKDAIDFAVETLTKGISGDKLKSAEQTIRAIYGNMTVTQIKDAMTKSVIPTARGQRGLEKDKWADLSFDETIEAYLYKHDLPDEDIARYLDYDAPLSEQPEALAKARQHWDDTLGDPDIVMQRLGISDTSTGRELYQALGGVTQRQQAASEALGKAGIPGLKYFDGMSRNKPTKDIKKSFQDELPDDAGFDEIDDLLGTGHFSPDSEEILQALKDDDWFGFDYPSQAISAALGKNINNWDPSARLTQAIAKAREGGTRNFVTWDQDVLNRMKLLERNGINMLKVPE